MVTCDEACRWRDNEWHAHGRTLAGHVAGQVIEARFYPTDQYLAVLIRIDGRTANIRRWKDREAALRWAEAVRGVYASFGAVLPGAERLGLGDDAE